jgi:hypothetical protein
MPLLLYLQERTPGTRWIGNRVGPRAGLDDVEKRKFLTLLGLELWPLGHPACRKSLYQLRYSCSSFNRLHGIISQKIELIIITTMRTSNPTWSREFLNPKVRKGTPLSATFLNLYRDKVVTRQQNELRDCDGCSV